MRSEEKLREYSGKRSSWCVSAFAISVWPNAFEEHNSRRGRYTSVTVRHTETTGAAAVVVAVAAISPAIKAE